MRKETPPKKPLTPFFIFRDKEKAKGVAMGGKEAGEKWAALSKEEKKPYTESYRKAKEKFDKYLETVEGLGPRTSSKKKGKPTSFTTSKVRAIWGRKKDIKSLNGNELYKAMGRVSVKSSLFIL